MKEFKKFLREFQGEPPTDRGFGSDPGDSHNHHIREYLGELHKVLKNTPFIHNTPEGTYKFKSLYHALAGHASHGVHGIAMSSAPMREISSLGNQMALGYLRFGDMMEPHVHRAVERTKTRISDNNPFKFIPKEELTTGIYASFLEGSREHLDQLSAARYPDTRSHPTIAHFMRSFPKIKQQLETHPYQFIFDGGHLGDLPEDQSDLHGRAANFFPKWDR